MTGPPLRDPRPSDWEIGPAIPEYAKRETFEAAWFLTSSRFWPLVRDPVRGPIVLGLLLAAVIVAAVIFSPSTESRFIYTDF